MKKIDLNTFVQAIAMLGVMGSLIFVGLQMRQSQELALAAQNTERANMRLASIDSLAEQGMSYHTMLKQIYKMEPFTEDYRWLIENQGHAHWFIAENDYLQHALGLMDDNIWEARLAGFRVIYNICEVRELYAIRRPTFDKRFVEMIESTPDECPETDFISPQDPNFVSPLSK